LALALSIGTEQNFFLFQRYVERGRKDKKKQKLFLKNVTVKLRIRIRRMANKHPAVPLNRTRREKDEGRDKKKEEKNWEGDGETLRVS